jgi:hypothetical protein
VYHINPLSHNGSGDFTYTRLFYFSLFNTFFHHKIVERMTPEEDNPC